jgi:hypothetical protein
MSTVGIWHRSRMDLPVLKVPDMPALEDSFHFGQRLEIMRCIG